MINDIRQAAEVHRQVALHAILLHASPFPLGEAGVVAESMHQLSQTVALVPWSGAVQHISSKQKLSYQIAVMSIAS